MLRPLLRVCVIVLSLSGGHCAADRPNFVFLLVDDLGWADVGVNGSTFYETPHIDALARSGMQFTSGYAACHVCSPTRAALMTGKHPVRVDITNFIAGMRPGKYLSVPFKHELALEEVTIAEALKEAGYATCFAGKWHLGNEGFFPEDQGFDFNFGGHHRGQPPAGDFSPYKNPRLKDGPKGENLTDRLGEESVRFIKNHKDGPFFLYLSFYTVHNPQQPKPELLKKYQAKAAALPESDRARFLPEGKWHTARQVQDHAAYASMVQVLDENVGRVLKALDEFGLNDNTVVLFTSDNGGLSTSEGQPTSNLPLRGGKGWHYEGGVREATFVRWPGVTEAGDKTDVPVISTDFYPTMLEMAGLESRPQQHVDGVSLVPLLKGKSLAPRALYWHYPHYSNQGGNPSGAIRAGDYKLIEWFEDRSVELYNVVEDIGERTDLAAGMPQKTAELRDRLHLWQKQTGAKFPTELNPNYDPTKRRARRRPVKKKK